MAGAVTGGYEMWLDDLFVTGPIIDPSGTGPNTNYRIINNVFQIFDIDTNGFREVWFETGVLKTGPSVP